MVADARLLIVSAPEHAAGELCGSPTKRRHIETSPSAIRSTTEVSTSPAQNASGDSTQSQTWEDVRDGQVTAKGSPRPTSPPARSLHPATIPNHGRRGSHDLETQASRSQAEEATIYTETRMLQDQTGRLLYMGDASTLSILQLIRIIVESTAGPEIGARFIEDPNRHRIMENLIRFPENTLVPCQLPDRETTDVLVDSYFVNTCGLIEVMDKKIFMDKIDSCYADPLTAESSLLCHLFLVLALGLVLSAPISGSREEEVIRRLQDAQLDRAEHFFRSAKSMCNPDNGFEDDDFWSVQALSLMALYMLAVSKRNTAYAYLGMAVRSAYALGLHREETMNPVIFRADQIRERRNMWKTLFIMDRFLAASLGRPTAISEDDCSHKIMPEKEFSDPYTSADVDIADVHSKSIDACVRSSHMIGVTLGVFSQRKISTTVVQKIAGTSKDLRQAAQTGLFSRLANEIPSSAAQGIATLHVHLLSLHSLILLTRQLFIMHNWKLAEQRSGMKKPYTIKESPMAKYSEACVIASYHTIRLVQRARDAEYLPRRNPFIIYFLFAASLIVFMNRFSCLYQTDLYPQTITDAIAIMRYCAQTDPQAERLLDIMERFHEVVEKWTKDHTYHAPTLSSDLGGLYAPQPGNSRLAHDHSMWVANMNNMNSPREQEPPQLGSIPHRTTAMNNILPPLSEMVVSQSPTMDIKMNGMSPHQMMSPPFVHSIPARPSVSSHSMSDGSESANGHIEFSFDRLWENWEKTAQSHPGPSVLPSPPGHGPIINHITVAGPGSLSAGGAPLHSLPSLPPTPQFPPPPTPVQQHAPGAPVSSPSPASFAAYQMHSGSASLSETNRIPPISSISPSIPLYHNTNYG
ncbi:activator of stress genes 1 [Rhypophila sp. PSN 637]